MLEDGPERLSRFRDRIEDDRTAKSKHFTAFKANVSTAIGNRRWFISTGASPLVGACSRSSRVGALLFFFAINGWRPVVPALERHRPDRRSASAASSTPRSSSAR